MHVLNCYIIVFQACNFWLGSSFETTILACFEMRLWVSELGVDACTTPLLAWFSHEEYLTCLKLAFLQNFLISEANSPKKVKTAQPSKNA